MYPIQSAYIEVKTWRSVGPCCSGDYDTFQKTLESDAIIQQKKFDKEQADIKHLKAGTNRS